MWLCWLVKLSSIVLVSKVVLLELVVFIWWGFVAALEDIVLDVIGLVSNTAQHAFEIITAHRAWRRVVVSVLPLHVRLEHRLEVRISFLLHCLVFFWWRELSILQFGVTVLQQALSPVIVVDLTSYLWLRHHSLRAMRGSLVVDLSAERVSHLWKSIQGATFVELCAIRSIWLKLCLVLLVLLFVNIRLINTSTILVKPLIFCVLTRLQETIVLRFESHDFGLFACHPVNSIDQVAEVLLIMTIISIRLLLLLLGVLPHIM